MDHPYRLLLCERECEPKRGPGAGSALDTHPSTVLFDDRPANVQSQAEAAAGAARLIPQRHTLYAPVALPDMRLLLHRQAWSLVAHLHVCRCAFQPQADCHGLIRGGIL